MTLRGLFLKLARRRRLQQDLEAELAFHKEMAGGQENAIPLGHPARIQEQAFDLWRFNFIENLWRDLLYAIRGLRRNPALVISALLSLGLGIGVNAAMFSLGVEFLFSTPSLRDAPSMVSIRLGGNSNASSDAIEFLRRSGIFSDVVGENEEALVNYNDGTRTQRVFAVYTTKNYFTSLAVPMAVGRGFIPSDSKEAVVLSYRFWRKNLNGEPSVVGRSINLDGRLCVVTGILPEHHRGLLGFGFSPDIYMPSWLEATTFQIYARLKPDTSISQARAALLIVAKRMDAEIPDVHTKYAQSVVIYPVAGYRRFTSESELLPIGIFFLILLLITGLVLLIACINVAALVLTRNSARKSEIAVRLSLGAGGKRLIQQFLIESVVLVVLGTATGLVLAEGMARLLARIQLPLPVPIHLQITPDWRVLVYSSALSLLAIIVCGLLPAWQSLRQAIGPNLKREGGSRLRRGLVTAQIAASVVLLVTGSLFLRNLVNANSISPGFDVRHTLRADVNLSPSEYNEAIKKAEYIRRVLSEVEAIPGMEGVAACRLTPFTDNSSYGSSLRFSGTGEPTHVYFKWNAVTSDFFSVMGIAFKSGRTFANRITGENVVIVNDVFIRSFLNGRNAVGATFEWVGHTPSNYRIVGVVAGTKTVTIGEDPQPQLYEPLAQIDNDSLRIQFVMRSAIPPVLQLEPVRGILYRVDPMAGAQVETMYSSIGLAFLPSQVGAVLIGMTGILGLLLAAIGLYGVMAYSVTRRTREIGVRMAIGASLGDVSQMVIVDVLKMVAIGSVIGLLIAIFVTKPLAMFLVPGLSPRDPLSFFLVLVVMLLTGIAAAWSPVRRAVRIDPNAALRYE